MNPVNEAEMAFEPSYFLYCAVTLFIKEKMRKNTEIKISHM